MMLPLEPEAWDNMQTEMPKEVSSEGLAQSLASVGPLGWLMEGFSFLSRVVTNTLTKVRASGLRF